jgi:alpha-glucosidase
VIEVAAVLLVAAAALAEEHTVISPDELAAVTVVRGDAGLSYQVSYGGRVVVLDSALGFDGIAPGKFLGESRRTSMATWKPLYGERAVIPDRFNELTLRFERLTLTFRAYEEGVAFHYQLEGKGTFEVTRENTEFRFPEGSKAWEEHGTEGEYQVVEAASIRPGCERPLTVFTTTGIWAAVAEGGQTDFPRMLLEAAPGGGVRVDLDGAARGTLPFSVPWRLLVLGRQPGDLLERNYLVLDVSSPQAPLGDTRWIQPGKVIREVTLSTKGGKAAVDFAEKRGLDYIEYDAGWYGEESSDASDATRVSVDPKRIANIPDHGGLDLDEVIGYAKSKGIGVLLYVNRRALERQMDTLFPLYHKWGVAGVKFGFVQVQGQEWSAWLTRAIAGAAREQLMVDVHDSYRPSGLTRTYPNLMTVEGVRGNEHMPTARHNTTLPFTRAIAGAYDYTICWTTPRLKTTHAHQLAMSVVVYSPLQFLFWYDRPDQVEEKPELEFFRDVAVVWDETRVLAGYPGEFAVVARRSEGEWFLGAITNERNRTMAVKLGMLAPRAAYTARTYCDGETPQQVKIEQLEVTSDEPLVLKMAANGGCAVHLAPK